MSIFFKNKKRAPGKNFDDLSNFLFIFLKIGTHSIFTLKTVIEHFKKQKVCFEINLVINEDEVENYFLDFKKPFNGMVVFLINFGKNLNFQDFLGKKLDSLSHVYILKSSIDFSFQFPFSNKISIIEENFFSSISFFKTDLKKKKKSNEKDGLQKLISKKIGISTLFTRPETFNYSNLIWLESIKTANLLFYKKIDKKMYTEKMVFLRSKYIDLQSLGKKEKNLEETQNFFLEKYLTFNEKEIPLDLLKHWTLLEAFVNSPLFSVKMKIWKKEGVKTLSGLFFRMGISLDQIHKKWKHTEKVFKKNFEFKFELECKNLGVDFEGAGCFVNFYEDKKAVLNFNKFEISAFDFSLAINYIFDIKLRDLKTNELKNFFWKAYDSIFDQSKIKNGIKKAKCARKFVTRLAGVILNKKTFISENFFRCVHLRENKKMTLSTLKELMFYLNAAFFETGFKKKTTIFFIHGKDLVFTFIYLHEQKKKNFIFNQINLMEKKTKDSLVLEDDPFFGFQIQKQSLVLFLDILRKG